MTRLNGLLLVAIALGTIGCSDAPAVNEAPISISGKLSQGGKPVGNVVLWFHPLDKGHLQSLPVSNDGAFVGELIAGNYSYYVGQSPAPNSAAMLKKIDPKYFEANLERSVSVEFGKELVLALD